MNVNEKLLNIENIFGYPVQPDNYDGKESEYITFNYADERSVLFADDNPIEDEANLQLHIWLNISNDYMELKDGIKKYLEEIEACDIAISVLTEELKRHIVFEFTMLEGRS